MGRPWKVCVLPHSLEQLKINSNGRKYLNAGKTAYNPSDSSFENDYTVYLYDDVSGYSKTKLNLGMLYVYMYTS